MPSNLCMGLSSLNQVKKRVVGLNIYIYIHTNLDLHTTICTYMCVCIYICRQVEPDRNIE